MLPITSSLDSHFNRETSHSLKLKYVNEIREALLVQKVALASVLEDGSADDGSGDDFVHLGVLKGSAESFSFDAASGSTNSLRITIAIAAGYGASSLRYTGISHIVNALWRRNSTRASSGQCNECDCCSAIERAKF